MTLSHSFKVFIASARLGFKEVFAERLLLLGSFIIYGTLVVAYSSVFRGIPPEDLAAHQLTLSQMIWYFGATEFVLFCSSFNHFKELQYDIQNDNIHLSLLRPCPVWVLRVGEWAGQSLARSIVLFVPCFGLIAFMAGGVGFDVFRSAGFIISLPLATLILLCFYFILGTTCLWLTQAEPAFWVWQKCLFLFGALLWPLLLYPDIFNFIAWVTPFPAILAAPAQWALDTGVILLIGGYVHQVFWSLVLLALAAWVNRAMLHSLQKSGA